MSWHVKYGALFWYVEHLFYEYVYIIDQKHCLQNKLKYVEPFILSNICLSNSQATQLDVIQERGLRNSPFEKKKPSAIINC